MYVKLWHLCPQLHRKGCRQQSCLCTKGSSTLKMSELLNKRLKLLNQKKWKKWEYDLFNYFDTPMKFNLSQLITVLQVDLIVVLTKEVVEDERVFELVIGNYTNLIIIVIAAVTTLLFLVVASMLALRYR